MKIDRRDFFKLSRIQKLVFADNLGADAAQLSLPADSKVPADGRSFFVSIRINCIMTFFDDAGRA
jgi:hypothetical protein